MRPPQIRAGDSVSWRVRLPGYPAESGWQLHYALRGPQGIDIEALEGEGGDYLVEVVAADSSGWQAGLYRWVAYVVGPAGQRLTKATGDLHIYPDLLALDGPEDMRSHARRMLDLIEAALEKRIPKDQQSYEIDGQRLDRIPIERLEALRIRYRREVAQESRRGNGPFGRTVKWSYPA
jgi:hypothetical protein